MPSPFPYSPAIREWSWKKTQIEKKKFFLRIGVYVWLFGKKDTLFIQVMMFWHPNLKRPSAMVLSNSRKFKKQVQRGG